jgi:hypothetical protein
LYYFALKSFNFRFYTVLNRTVKMGMVPKRPVAVATPGSSRPGNSKTDKCRSADIQRDSRKDERTSRKDKRTSRKEKARKVKKGIKLVVNSKTKKTDRSNKKGKLGSSRDGSFRRNRKKASSRKDNYRTKYSKEDMEKAVRLVREDNWSIMAAVKEAGVPRMTLGDRLKNFKNPMEEPKVGRPQELLLEEEEAIVKCLTLCAEF